MTHHRPSQHLWSGYTAWGCVCHYYTPAESSQPLYNGLRQRRCSHSHFRSFLGRNAGIWKVCDQSCIKIWTL